MGFQEILIFSHSKALNVNMRVPDSLFAIAKGYIFLDSSFMNFVMNCIKYGQLLTSLPFTFM